MMGVREREMRTADGDLMYVLGDGDRIRSRVESLLLGAELEDLRAFSTALTIAIRECGEILGRELAGEVIVSGGDDLLVIAKNYDRRVLLDVSRVFLEKTGCTISFGVSRTVESAFISLRRAKAMGGGMVVDAA